MSKKKFKKLNTLVLYFASNTCYPNIKRLKDFEDERLSVNLTNGNWGYKQQPFHQDLTNVPVGRARITHNGLIGVYDKTKTNHLQNLLHEVTQYTLNKRSYSNL